jgi:hypothetical protein
LDTFFTQINDPDTGHSHYAYMGNEPCSETPWIYSFLGRPYRTSAVVRQCVNQLFSTAPTGLPGNDDLGQMASWYVFAALGMYPEIPGDTVLILNGPLFPEAVVHLTTGDVTITGGAGDDAPYVQSLKVNGHDWNAPWIRFTDLAGGSTLAFTMSATANTNWGADLSVAPPSYMDGMTAPFAPTCAWGTGLEANDPPLSHTNTVDNDAPGGGLSNVGPIVSSASEPELVVRSENSQSGHQAIMYSGKATGAATDYAYLSAFDVTGQNLTVSTGMHLSYWVFPQSPSNSTMTSGSNSDFVALDLVFTDGSDLRDSGLTDQHGTRLHPENQGSQLVPDTWNYVTVDLTPLAGKTVSRIDVGYDHPNGNGGYRGYVDDIAFTTPSSWFTNNLALNKPATADSEQPGSVAGNGNDGSTGTGWIAGDTNTNHWWQVDLGASCNLNADEILWPASGVIYDYVVATSLDGTSWTTVAYKAANTSRAQDQSDVFVATARYVRIDLNGLPAGQPSGFTEFRVFGSKIVIPSAPTGLQAFGGFGFVSLNWPAAAGATRYTVKRSTSSGTEAAVATVTGTNYTDRELAGGTKYYYAVSAANMLGDSGNSAEVSADLITPAPDTYQAALVAAHPVAYWPLTETSGAIAFDPVGGCLGTYVGGVALGHASVGLSGFGARSLSPVFDGTSGYVDIPAGPFNCTNALTVIAWVNVPSVPGHYSGVVGHGDSSWRLTVDPAGQPGAADGAAEDATSHTTICGNRWHMLAYAYSGTPGANDNATLYVDGVAAAHNTVTTITGGDGDVFIGGSPDYGDERLLPGSIAQVALFTNSLTGMEILNLYKAAGGK